MSFAPADERAHAPGPASEWCETWQLDAAADDGIGLALRLTLAPALGVAWWWTHLIVPDRSGPVVVRDHEVGLPRQGLEIRADGLWAELTCETPFEHWTYGLEAFGVALDDAADSLHGEIGERLPVGLDIEWETEPELGSLLEHRDGLADGYEQFGRVHGEVLLERSRLELDAVGVRSHSWGAPRVDVPARAMWLRARDLSISFRATDHGVDGDIARGHVMTPITSVRSESHRRADGLPAAARHVVDDRYEIDADVLGLVAIPLVGPSGGSSVLSRALCRYEVADGEEDTADPAIGPIIGWSSWLDPG